jgi:hypothetical protein
MAYSSIVKPSDYFNTKLYTGNGGTQSITGVGFQPDFNWTKGRNVGTFHMLTDAVRGATKVVQSNTNTAEQTFASGLTSFDSDGFTAGNSDDINGNYNYASWNWLGANGTASNSDGSITSTVSANTTAGFSIVKWTSSTGADTVGHGLGVTPQVVISKTRSVSNNWTVHTTIIDGSNDYLFLNTTDASGNSSYAVPTSSIFNFNYGSSTDLISYVFAQKKGYSKFGSYTGNGNADGPFVYTGFKPAFVMIKRTDAAGHFWHIYDNKRSSSGGSNIIDDVLYPNRSDAEYSGDKLDIISNGIKFRSGNTDINASGGTYIYMAFAEEPLVANVGQSIPATAR